MDQRGGDILGLDCEDKEVVPRLDVARIKSERFFIPFDSPGLQAARSKQVPQPGAKESVARSLFDEPEQVFFAHGGGLDESAVEQSTAASANTSELPVNLGPQCQAQHFQ